MSIWLIPSQPMLEGEKSAKRHWDRLPFWFTLKWWLTGDEFWQGFSGVLCWWTELVQICITIYGGKNISCLFIGNNAPLALFAVVNTANPNLQKRLWKTLLAAAVNQSRADFFCLSLLPSSIWIILPAELPGSWCWALQAARLSASNLLSWLGVFVHKGECFFPLVKSRAKRQCLGLRSCVDNLRSNCLARNASVQGTKNLYFHCSCLSGSAFAQWSCSVTQHRKQKHLSSGKWKAAQKHVEDVDQSWDDVVSEKSPLRSCHFRISFWSSCWLKVLYPTDITGAQ